MSEQLAAPAMPWKIEMYPRAGGEQMPWIVAADGMSRCATAEEVQVWEYVESLRIELTHAKSQIEPARVEALAEKIVDNALRKGNSKPR